MRSQILKPLLFVAVMMGMLTTVRADDDTEPVVVILFMFFGLGVGIIIMQILSVLGDPLPYTVVVFTSGLLFSLADKSNAGLFGDSISEWVDIDADLLLFTFLPPLIFGEAMSLNFYHVKGGLLQALLLAGPGVLIGAALVGVATKFMLPYNWNWNLALTFGSILSATDPVAVVALLKSAGASPKLTILIVGESLLNDGTAMVLFTIFYESLNGRLYTPASIAYFFATAAVGSVLMGLFCGFLIIRWLRTAHRPLKEIDTTIQIAITITCAYLIFFTAQYVLKISGVLACCGAGIVLAWLAPPIILNHETMHHVWGMIEWSLNTLIFLLAGLIIGNRVINKVAAIDWMYVVVLYVILMLVRLAVIAMLYPWLSTWGHKCTKQEAIFMSWAGLRGALGMALALIVEHNCPDHLQSETSRMFFYVGGIAALTMIINATTAKQLLVYLGLLGNDTAEKNLVMQQIKKRLKRRMDSVLVELAAEFSFTEQDLDEVRESCSLLADSNMDLLRESIMQQSSVQSSLQRPSLMSIQAAQRSPASGAGAGAPGSAAEAQERDSSSNNSSTTARGRDSSLSLQRPPPVAVDSTRRKSHGMRSPTTPASARSVSVAGGGVGFVLGDDDDDLPTNNPASSLFGDRQPGGGMRRVVSSGSLRIARLESEDIEEGETSFTRADAERVNMQRQSRASGRYTSRTFSHSSHSANALTDAGTQQQRHKSGAVRADEVLRMLSMAHRGDNALIQPQLLTYVRAIFLEILRVRYWNDIEKGKIPRQSHSAKFLLYSVEVAVDEVEQDAGVRDWRVIRKEITEMPLSIRLLSYFDESFKHAGPLGYSTYYLGKLEARREKRAVYMLTSFIDAHEHAQAKVHEFIVTDDDEEHQQSPEELKVIEESKQAVEAARHLLNAMSADTVAKIRAKQAAALVLTKQAEMIKNMVGEGLLTPQHAEEFLEEIGNDLQRMDKDRNKMYWEQGESLARKRQALKREEGRDTFAGRYSVFSLFDWQKRTSSASPHDEGDADQKEEIYLGPNSVTSAAREPLMQAVDGSQQH